MAEKELKKLLTPCSDGDLGSVVRRAQELGELTSTLSDGLPDDFAGAVVAANVRENGVLVVIAASSAWANRLRYETDALLTAARAAGLTVSGCQIRVSSG
jgi:hypothetical protein